MRKPGRTLDVLLEVFRERERQEARWGQQDHKSGTGLGCLQILVDKGASAADAKGVCERAFQQGRGTYLHILWEEVAEAAEEDDDALLRAEMVQVAAVAVAFIESIDRRMARAQQTSKEEE